MLQARVMSSSIWSYQQYLLKNKIIFITQFSPYFVLTCVTIWGSPFMTARLLEHNPTFAILIHWMVSDVLRCDTFYNVPCTISLPICMQQRHLLVVKGTCRHTNWVEQSAPRNPRQPTQISSENVCACILHYWNTGQKIYWGRNFWAHANFFFNPIFLTNA